MGVQVHGLVEAFAQRQDELFGCLRAQQPRHVLDRDDVGTRLHHVFCEAQVIVQGVQVLGGVQKVSAVTQRHLGNRRVRGENRIDCGAHLVNVVEGIKNAENIDTRRGRFLHKRFRHFGGIGGVPHGVSPSKQHLNRNVGQRLTHLR